MRGQRKSEKSRGKVSVIAIKKFTSKTRYSRTAQHNLIVAPAHMSTLSTASVNTFSQATLTCSFLQHRQKLISIRTRVPVNCVFPHTNKPTDTQLSATRSYAYTAIKLEFVGRHTYTQRSFVTYVRRHSSVCGCIRECARVRGLFSLMPRRTQSQSGSLVDRFRVSFRPDFESAPIGRAVREIENRAWFLGPPAGPAARSYRTLAKTRR